MTEDELGNIWIATENGLSRLLVNSSTFIGYGKSDGLLDKGYDANALYFSQRYNRLYCGKDYGLYQIQLRKPSGLMDSHGVKVSSVRVNEENWIYAEEKSLAGLEEGDQLELALTSQDYGYRSSVRIRYKSVEEDKWIELPSDNPVIIFPSLTSGIYKLEIQSTDGEGKWSERVLRLDIQVRPYFYKSWWFLLLLLMSVVCLSILFYRYKVRRLRHRQVLLEQLVAQRTHELEVQNHSLEVMAHHVEDMAEEKIRFFTHLTHEFRTPVTLIHGPIQQALALTSDKEVKEQLHIAERNVQDLLSLVNELMDFRKLDTEKVKLNIRPFDLISMIDDLLLPFISFVKHRHITLQACYHLKGLSVNADPTYLHRVLTNLLANAVKFTPDGGNIRLYAARLVDNKGKVQLYLSVSDTGCGIPEKDLPQIFDSFFQAQNKVTYPVFGQTGTGIGLNVCKRIVALHGGVISAKNNRAGGTSFRVLLPMKEMPTEELSAVNGMSEEDNSVVTEDNSLQKATLLVVDDNHDMRRYIRSLLKNEYKLLEAENGVEAMKIIEKHQVD